MIKKSNEKKTTVKINKSEEKSSEKSSSQKSGKGADLVAERRSFYRKSLSQSKISAIVTGVSALALVAIGFFTIATSKETVYFQIDNENRIVSLVPLTEPRHSNAFVADWLNKCMVSTFDFYYGDMDRKLDSMKGRCYSERGFESLISGLKGSGNYDAIKKNELFSSFSFEATPVVVRTASDQGSAYKWMLQGKGQLTLTTTTKTFPNNANVTAVVTRSSLLDDNIGLSIEKILIQTRNVR
jgi:hypothetical protein